jgi:hypothetical protein
MNFYPENRFPKKGIPFLDGSGEQYKLSNPRYDYKDGIENNKKIKDSSTDNLFSTIEAAKARSYQIGCGGYHEVIIEGKTYYKPCESVDYYEKRIEQLDSSLNFKYIGSYRILSWDKPFENVNSFKGWIIDAANSNNSGSIIDSNDISIDFRYSIDGKTWSLWTNVGTALGGLTNNFSEIFPINLNPKDKFYPQFRFTSVLRNDDGTIIFNSDEIIDPSVVIADFKLDLEFSDTAESPVSRPAPVCSDEISNRPVVFDRDCKFTFNPYSVNKAINLYQDLSLMVNKVFGLDVNYYSVQPQGRGKDVILKEYTLFNVVAEKCIKVMVQQNQLPDNKINYDPFGLQFEEPFEIQIDKRYFEEAFGRGSQPRKRDILYFPITNRIYQINSTYLFRDFMNSPVYFKIELRKYSPRSNTYFEDPAHKEELESISITTTELFGEEIKNEELKVAKPQQYSTTINQFSQDPIRSYLYKDLPIIEYDLNNNWTIILNQYYDLSEAFVDSSEFTEEPNRYRNAVRYKKLPSLGEKEEIALTAWFSIKNFHDNSKLSKSSYPIINMNLDSFDDDKLIFNTYPQKHNLSRWISYSDNPEGYVSISGDEFHSGGYKVDSVIDDYSFAVENRSAVFSQGTIKWKMQKAQSRNIISGLYKDQFEIERGFRVDIVHSGVPDDFTEKFINEGSIFIKLNNIEIKNRIKTQLEYGSWYGLVINVSNLYKQISSNLWEIAYDPVNPNDQSSKLKNISNDIRYLDDSVIFSAPPEEVKEKDSVFYLTDNNSYKIFTGPVLLSNIRIFKNMIDTDTQSTVLNQNIVRDEQLAHVIDNAKIPLNIPKFARNR